MTTEMRAGDSNGRERPATLAEVAGFLAAGGNHAPGPSAILMGGVVGNVAHQVVGNLVYEVEIP